MSTYQTRLTADMKAAMKTADKDRLQVIRMLIHGLKEEQMRVGRDALKDAEELAVLQRALKARRDAVAQARELGRDDVAAAESREIEVVEAYLPEQLEGAALQAAVAELATELGYSGPKDTGRFMKEWMARHPGRADGRAVQAALKDFPVS